uniref:piggyBac transposable element-derived protein 4-like n=1 Tax=Styela clava TaxID=7725 RepID=UPI00193A1DF5|nr:piggyBac transposable element-derived protein 4-like [Styela clava]
MLQRNIAKAALQRYYEILTGDESEAPAADNPNKDKMFQVRKFLSIILPLFENAYSMGREISIDETLIPFKGRISFRQFIKTKRARFGIKVWVLAESSTGYVSRLQFYTGKDPTSNPEEGLSSRVVKYLMEPFVDMNHHLYVDNFYTSPELFSYLLSKGIYACGTFRANRIGFPKELIIKSIRSLQRGATDWRMAGDLLAQSWVDNRAVCFLTTIHNPEYTSDYSGSKTVKRKRGRSTSQTSEISCPQVLKDYNSHIGGVDLSDQMRKYYNLTRRSKVLYRRVFSYIIEVALHNARVLADNIEGKHLDGFTFRMAIVTGLIGDHRSPRRGRAPF